VWTIIKIGLSFGPVQSNHSKLDELHGDAAGDDRVAHKDIGAVGAWDEKFAIDIVALPIRVPSSISIGAVSHLSMYSKLHLHFTCLRTARNNSVWSMLPKRPRISNSSTRQRPAVLDCALHDMRSDKAGVEC
jgi:hypothetical protein